MNSNALRQEFGLSARIRTPHELARRLQYLPDARKSGWNHEAVAGRDDAFAASSSTMRTRPASMWQNSCSYNARARRRHRPPNTQWKLSPGWNRRWRRLHGGDLRSTGPRPPVCAVRRRLEWGMAMMTAWRLGFELQAWGRAMGS